MVLPKPDTEESFGFKLVTLADHDGINDLKPSTTLEDVFDKSMDLLLNVPGLKKIYTPYRDNHIQRIQEQAIVDEI
jgi:hypothetical protein